MSPRGNSKTFSAVILSEAKDNLKSEKTGREAEYESQIKTSQAEPKRRTLLRRSRRQTVKILIEIRMKRREPARLPVKSNPEVPFIVSFEIELQTSRETPLLHWSFHARFQLISNRNDIVVSFEIELQTSRETPLLHWSFHARFQLISNRNDFTG